MNRRPSSQTRKFTGVGSCKNRKKVGKTWGHSVLVQLYCWPCISCTINVGHKAPSKFQGQEWRSDRVLHLCSTSHTLTQDREVLEHHLGIVRFSISSWCLTHNLCDINMSVKWMAMQLKFVEVATSLVHWVPLSSYEHQGHAVMKEWNDCARCTSYCCICHGAR